MKIPLTLSALAMTSFAAFGQSNVTIYGLIDQGITWEKNGAGKVVRMDSGTTLGSRVGFRGKEDLGGGLTALFAVEMGVNADTGTFGQGGIGFGRQSWVGLAGDFGSVKAGRQYIPIYNSQYVIDPFLGGYQGDMTSGRGFFQSFNYRANNSVIYSAPVLNGLQLNAIYAFGEVEDNTKASRQFGWSADYAKGPVEASLAYHSVNNALANDNQHSTFAGATYDFGFIKIHGAVDDVKGLTANKVRDYMVGISAPIGLGRLAFSVVTKKNRTVEEADARQIGLGYMYFLSKRTSLYATVAHVHNDRNSGVNAGGVNGATDKIGTVGVRHNF